MQSIQGLLNGVVEPAGRSHYLQTALVSASLPTADNSHEYHSNYKFLKLYKAIK